MKHAKHRLLGILAAGVLGFSSVIQAAPIQLLMPVTASAAQNQITKLTVYGIEPPIIGNSPVTEDVFLLSNANASIYQVDWVENDTGMVVNPNSTFESGKTYKVRVFVLPDSDYEFPSTLSTLNVYNGTEDAAHKGQATAVSGLTGAVCAQFTFSPVASVTVDSLLITGMDYPKAGDHPVMTGITVDESRKVSVHAVRWMEEGKNGFMKDTDVFEAGKEYTCKVYLEPKTGYSFPYDNLKSMSVWFHKRNDESYADEVLRVNGSDTQICVNNTYTCTEKPKTTVKSLLITGMDNPKAGANPVMKGITVEEDDQVTIAAIRWGEKGKSEALNADSVFEAGKEYYLNVYLEPKDGYTFPYDDLKSMSVWFNKRNDESFADDILPVYGKDTQICVSNEYTCPEAKTVDSLLITGMEYPKAGEHPVMEGLTVDNSDAVSIVSFYWYEEGKTGFLSEDDVFSVGKSYTLSVYMETKPGYTFPYDDMDSMSVWFHKRNDESNADSVLRVNGSENRICVENCYSIPAQTIDSLLITGMDYPKAGDHPVMTGITVDESLQAEIVAVRWMEEGKNGFMKDTDVFEAGKEYTCKVYLEPKDGYTFPYNDLKSMSVWFHKRNDESYADEILRVSGSDTQICVNNTYTCTERLKTTVKSLLITGMDYPKAGANPVMKGIAVEEDDQVTITAIQWRENGATGFLNADSVFEAGKEYSLDVYIEPKDGYTFPYDDLESMNIWFHKRNDESFADSVLRVDGSENRIRVTNEYTCPEAKTVDSLLITGMDYPKAGEHPVTVGLTVDVPDEVSIAAFKWVEEGKADALSEDYVFEAGKSYELLVYMEPKPGYTFPYDKLDSMSVWFHKRNDESYADSVLRVHGSETQICAENCYSIPEQKVDSLLITGIERPYAGDKPDFTLPVVDEADKVTVKSFEWWVKTEDGSERMAEDAVFTLGTEYKVRVILEPKSGYTFPMDSLNDMDIYFGRRSDETFANWVLKVADHDNWICAEYSYICIEKESPALQKGDVDGNGEVQSADAQSALVAFTEVMTGNPNPLSDEETLRADVDGDGQLTVNDPQLILVYYTANKVSGIPTTWEELIHPEA